MRKSEAKVLLAMLPAYYAHMAGNPHTLVTRFFGVHRITPAHGRAVRGAWAAGGGRARGSRQAGGQQQPQCGRTVCRRVGQLRGRAWRRMAPHGAVWRIRTQPALCMRPTGAVCGDGQHIRDRSPYSPPLRHQGIDRRPQRRRGGEAARRHRPGGDLQGARRWHGTARAWSTHGARHTPHRAWGAAHGAWRRHVRALGGERSAAGARWLHAGAASTTRKQFCCCMRVQRPPPRTWTSTSGCSWSPLRTACCYVSSRRTPTCCGARAAPRSDALALHLGPARRAAGSRRVVAAVDAPGQNNPLRAPRPPPCAATAA